MLDANIFMSSHSRFTPPRTDSTKFGKGLGVLGTAAPAASRRITTEDTKRQNRTKRRKTTRNPNQATPEALSQSDERTACSHSAFLSKVRSLFSSCTSPPPRSSGPHLAPHNWFCRYWAVSLLGHGWRRSNANAAPKGSTELHLETAQPGGTRGDPIAPNRMGGTKRNQIAPNRLGGTRGDPTGWERPKGTRLH